MQAPADIYQFCISLPSVTHVVRWGGSDVYKIGGKVFAVADVEAGVLVTFKTSETSFETLKSEPGIRPAPYMASRGLKWLQRVDGRTLDDQALRDYIRHSYAMVVAGLGRKQRMALDISSAQET